MILCYGAKLAGIWAFDVHLPYIPLQFRSLDEGQFKH